MRLIDADYLNNNLFRNCPIEEGGIPLADFATHIKILKMYPTVDAGPVIRCKDCRHRDWRQSPEHGKVETVCKHPGGLKNPRKDGFCSYGERKDNGTK